jgi:hypothetical protein
MTQSYRGFCYFDKASQLPSIRKRGIIDVKKNVAYTRRSNLSKKEEKRHSIWIDHDCHYPP